MATETETKSATTRSKPARPFDVSDVDFVFKNYNQMTASEISEDRGLALFQVNQIVSGLRKAGAELPKKTRTDIIKDYVEAISKKGGKKKTR